MRSASPRRVELGAESYDEQHWKSFNLVHHPPEHFQACRIDPMRIFEAGLEEINQHYRQAIRMYHPDKVAEMAPEIIALAERRTKELNAAFSETEARPHQHGQ